MVEYTRLITKTSSNKEQKQSEKDTQPFELVKAKVTKKPKGILNKMLHPLRSIKHKDKTLKLCEQLMIAGTDRSELKLPEAYLQRLSREQRRSYDNFSKKLDISAAKIKVSQLQNNSHRKSYDSDAESGYGSEGNIRTDDEERSTDTTTPLILQLNQTPKQRSEQSPQKVPKNEKQTSSIKKKVDLSTNKTRGIFKKAAKRLGTVVAKKKSRKNPIPLSYDNPNYDLTSANQKIVDDFVSTNSDAEIQISNEIKDDSNCLLEAIKNREQEKFKDHPASGEDITIQDEEGNNILHRIALLKKKQKCEFLDELVKCKKTSQESLAQLINCQNKDGKTPLQIALIAKIEKEKHKSNKPSDSDNTLKFLSQLLELGASPNQLELPEESLKNLSKTKKDYHHHFLKKLTELVKNPKLKEDTTNRVIVKVAQIIDDDGYPLHSAVRDGNKDQFNKLLRRGCTITTQDAEGNTVLHYALKLKKGPRLNFTRFILKKNKELLNTKNNNGLTPIYILLEQIKKKNEDRSCTDRQFEKTGRYQILKLLLESGTDITAQDKKGDNVLHHIALLKEEQKVTCLELVLNLVEQEELNKAFNATNQKGQTPLQVVLIAKITKDNHKWISPKSRDNTIKFCVKLLQNGVDQKQFTLHERLWNREYYKTIKGIEKLIGKALISDDMRTELKCNFGKKFKARDIVKYLNNVVCKVVITLVFAASISAVIFSASQGSIAIEVALPIIAAISVCYLIYWNVGNIYKGFGKIKEKFTAKEEVTPQGNTPTDNTDLIQRNNSDENLENGPNNQAIEESSDQPECAEKPSTQMDNIFVRAKSSFNHLLGCVGIQASTGHNR